MLLTKDELTILTGYKRPKEQVAELRRQGFFRARTSPTTGASILERAHYDAICAGARSPDGPKVRTPVLRQMRPA
jgi:hypothetical protein